MVSGSNEKDTDEIQQELEKTKDPVPLQIQSSQRGPLNENKRKNLYIDMIRAFPSKDKLKKFDPSPSFRRLAEEKDEISRSVPNAEQSSRRHFHDFVKKIDWASLREMCKQWIRDPMNMALFVWILCVTISGAILFLVMTGMLNGAIREKSQRDTWFEINNQILNALFTLMCLYQHPKRCYHLILLCRWRQDDILRLRKIYCKNGTYKPNEWAHMMVVVILLHLNCFAQYALCGLNLGYPRSKRPAIGVAICISVAIGAPAIASVYSILSPLGKEYETEIDQETQSQVTTCLRMKSFEKRYSFIKRENQRVAETRPEWVGGLYDVWDDISVAYLSFFCSCCVFGWNMHRLGFGNVYVHIATFLLFCLAPFFIFNLAAVNIDNEGVREAMGFVGFFLCVFGLLYGGFWRIQMRKRFNLPGNTFCFGDASVTDCLGWLFCCTCSLAQEVRTADRYDVVEDKLYVKGTSVDTQPVLSPSPQEDGLPLFTSSPSSPYNGKGSSTPRRYPGGHSPQRNSSTPRRSPGGHSPQMNSSTPRRSPDGHSPQMNLPTLDEESSVKSDGSSVRAPAPIIIQ